jgi:hypothetical protein
MPNNSNNANSPPDEEEEYDIVQERPPQETELETLDRVGKTEVLGLVSMQKVNAILMKELLKCNSIVNVPSENYHYEETVQLLDNANKKTFNP